MTPCLGVSGVRFTAAGPEDARAGLLGWVRFTLGGVVAVDGVAVRRTRQDRLALSFPSRRDRNGTDHPILRPLDNSTRRAIEAAVFRALRIDTEGGCDGR